MNISERIICHFIETYLKHSRLINAKDLTTQELDVYNMNRSIKLVYK